MKKHSLLLGCFLLFSITIYGQIAFNESAIAYGLDVSYGTGFVGGGISFCDFDGDGFPVIVVNSEASNVFL